MGHIERLVLGLVPTDRLRERDPRTRAFVRALGERAGIYLVERNVSSYEELEREMTLAHIDVAWLPPLVFARLEHDDVALAVATRAQPRGTYASVIVTTRESPIESLEGIRGKQIAWVDPLSASGYVVPRLALIQRGFDPPRAFSQEFFAGSHAEAMLSVLEGRADVAATFAHLDGEGRVVHGPWIEVGVEPHQVRVIAVLGEVPLDVVAARMSVADDVRRALGRALVAMAQDPDECGTLEAVFGCRDFVEGASSGYAAMRELLDSAPETSVGWTSEAFASTSPPPRSDRGARS